MLLAYGKLELSAEIVASTAPDDPFFEGALERYFPTGLKPYRQAMRGHRLRREIIATVQANAIVDIAGPTFPGRLKDATGCDIRGPGHRLRGRLAGVPAGRGLGGHHRAGFLLDACRRPVGPSTGGVGSTCAVRPTGWPGGWWAGKPASRGWWRPTGPPPTPYAPRGLDLLSPLERDVVQKRIAAFVEGGAPEALAASIGALRPLTAVSDVADLARAAGWAVLPPAASITKPGPCSASTRSGPPPEGLWPVTPTSGRPCAS
ncbi:MAG: hypothetical protein WDN45_07100 [Caulobacteraceae bacterium]